MSTKKTANKSIFISSTFRDMQGERDALRDIVLPRVNEFAGKYGRAVELIDLRWGVDTTATSEAEQNHKVLRTCLDEIERSRPFFIGLLGDRYGWTPPEMDMEASLKEAAFDLDNLNMSVTALEIEYGVLRSENPPICIFYFRKSPDYKMMPEEQRLIYQDEGEDYSKLTKLKDEIRTNFPEDVIDYTAEIYEGGLKVSKEWAEMVAEDIQEKLRQEWGDPTEALPHWREQEQEIQEAFRENRTEYFAGRSAVIAELTTYCLDENSEPQILMLQGEPGSGKSGLLCKVMEEIEDKCLLLPFVCGVSSRSTQVDDMLRYFISTICKKLSLEDDCDESTEFQALKERFMELLHVASEKTRVVMVVDALDQLVGGVEVNRMLWISGRLPENVRVLCSIIEGLEIDAVKQLGGKVKPMPIISREDEISIIHGIATRQRKQIGNAVVEHILQKQTPTGTQAAQNPLYLSLITQDLVMMNRYELNTIQQYMEDGLSHPEALAKFMCRRIDETPGDPDGAYLAILNRLEKLIDPDLVRGVCGLIAVSRTGLREIDLQNTFTELGFDFNLADFAWLRQMLRGHISQGDKQQWDFSHQSLRRALWRDREEELIHLNNSLIDYFCKVFIQDEFVIREIIHHLCLADRPDLAVEVVVAREESNIPALNKLIKGFGEVYTEHADGEKFLQSVVNSARHIKGSERYKVADIMRWSQHWFPENTRPFRIELMLLILNMLQGQEDETTIKKIAHYEVSLGDLYTEMGESEKAGVCYQKSLKVYEKLYAQSQSASALTDLSISYDRMGSYLTSQGEIEEAGAYYQKSLEAREKLYAQSQSASNLRNLTTSYNNMGDYLISQGEIEEAGTYYQKSLEAREKLYAEGRTFSLRDLPASYDRMGDYLTHQGEIEEAGAYYQKSLEVREKLYAQSQTASALSDLSSSYISMGDYLTSQGESEKAGLYYQKSLDVREKLYAQSQTASTLRALSLSFIKMGDHLISQGENERAGLYYRKSLEAREKLYAQSQTASDFHNLSASYIYMGNYSTSQGKSKEAGTYYLKSLEVLEQLCAQGPTVTGLRDLTVSYNKMGDYLTSQGESKEAGAYYQKSLEAREQLYTQSQTATDFHKLSASYIKMGNYLTSQGEGKKAGSYFKKSVDALEKLYAKSQTASVLRDLSVSYERMGNYSNSQGESKEAGAYYQKSLDAREQLYTQSQTASALRDLSTSYIFMGNHLTSQGKSKEAGAYYQKSLEAREQLYTQSQTASDFHNLSASYTYMGDYLTSQGKSKEAGAFYQKSLEALEQLNAQDPITSVLRDLALSYNNMGDYFISQKESDKASVYYQKALEVREKLYAQSQTATALRDLSVSYGKMGGHLVSQKKNKEAGAYYQKSQESFEKLYSQNPTASGLRDLSVLYNRIGDHLNSQGENEKAGVYYQKSLEADEQLYAQSQTATTLRDLLISHDRVGNNMFALKRFDEARSHREKALELYEMYVQVDSSYKKYDSYYRNKVNNLSNEV